MFIIHYTSYVVTFGTGTHSMHVLDIFHEYAEVDEFHLILPLRFQQNRQFFFKLLEVPWWVPSSPGKVEGSWKTRKAQKQSSSQQVQLMWTSLISLHCKRRRPLSSQHQTSKIWSSKLCMTATRPQCFDPRAPDGLATLTNLQRNAERYSYEVLWSLGFQTLFDMSILEDDQCIFHGISTHK